MNNNDLKKIILAKIQKKEISMRPRLYFVARVALVILLSLLIFIMAVFVLSFIFFSVHESGEQFLLGFGRQGFLTFLSLFPWITFVFTLGLVLLLEWLLRRFKFGYHISLSRIFLYLLVVTVFFSMIFTRIPVHTQFEKMAEGGRLPVIGGIYDDIHDSHQDKGVVRGFVSAIEGNTFVLSCDDNDRDRDDGIWTVIIPPHFDITTIQRGERVYVAGSVKDQTITAYGISEFPLPEDMK